jgi:hypothetical protein
MNFKINPITLLIILFVTLLIGIFINYNLTKEGFVVGENLRDSNGNLIYDKSGRNVKITSVNTEGKPTATNPSIILDDYGYPLLDENGDFRYFRDSDDENTKTLAQTYKAFAIQDAKNKGFLSGYAGSGKTPESTDYSQYKNAPTESRFNELSTYKVGNANDLNIQYHDTPEQIAANENADSLTGGAIIYDKDGNKITLPPIQANVQPTYYQPGTFIHSASNFVPTYEDSVYLSRSNGNGVFTDAKKGTPIYEAPYIQGGICTYYKNNPNALEEACNNVDPLACASTSCCVLLGGSKCVSGNETGATMKANYSDMYVINRDFYYFQGKCYGNCP